MIDLLATLVRSLPTFKFLNQKLKDYSLRQLAILQNTHSHLPHPQHNIGFG